MIQNVWFVVEIGYSCGSHVEFCRFHLFGNECHCFKTLLPVSKHYKRDDKC